MLQYVHIWAPLLITFVAIPIGIFVGRWASKKDFE